MTDLPRVVPAAVTPFSLGGAELQLDFIPQHMAYLEHRGADGLLTLGTNGEGVSLSMQERKDVIDAVLTHRGRLQIFAGTGCAALPETVELSRYAIERGVDAVMIVPPFYFKSIETPGLIAYYEAVLSALKANQVETALAEISMIPQSYVKLEGKNAQQLMRLLEALEEQDDVQHVYSNFDVEERELQAVSE